jgi:hypothetical protein
MDAKGDPMKKFAALTVAALTVVSLLLGSGTAIACGTPHPVAHSKMKTDDLAELQRLAHAASQDADEVFVGTVTYLTRSTVRSREFGTVSLDVAETLKGQSSSTRTAQWKETFVISCQESASFHNVGFRPGGKYIVYIRGGKVIRSGAADHLRSGLFTLEQERTIAAAESGS